MATVTTVAAVLGDLLAAVPGVLWILGLAVVLLAGVLLAAVGLLKAVVFASSDKPAQRFEAIARAVRSREEAPPTRRRRRR